MKRFFLICMVLLCESVSAQEGCGEWVHCFTYPRPVYENDSTGIDIHLWGIRQNVELDSIWVPKSCSEKTDTVTFTVPYPDTKPVEEKRNK